MSRWSRYLSIACTLVFALAVLWWFLPGKLPAPVAPMHAYADALQQVRAGMPGAARLLYQQLARTDLSDAERAELYNELPNFPGVQAVKLAETDLGHGSLAVREAALQSMAGLLPDDRRTLLLGPVLENDNEQLRFAAARALMDLSADDLGLYFETQQQVLSDYADYLNAQKPTLAGQLLLADIYLNGGAPNKAVSAVQRALEIEPDNLQAVTRQVELLDKQGQPEAARKLLAEQLARHGQSAYLQHSLGLWLAQHDQAEYALLSLSHAVELEPNNATYRYDLAVALHRLQQMEAAQKQLEDVLQRDPANRRVRVLLIKYWQESGQLQNVQVLLAELEQQNPDDPLLQQSL